VPSSRSRDGSFKYSYDPTSFPRKAEFSDHLIEKLRVCPKSPVGLEVVHQRHKSVLSVGADLEALSEVGSSTLTLGSVWFSVLIDSRS